MKGSIRVSAKTLDDAITEALIQLGVTSDKLEYEVIEKGSAGFLGIGMKQAVIEAWRKEEKEPEPDIREMIKEEMSLNQEEEIVKKDTVQPKKEKKDKREKDSGAEKKVKSAKEKQVKEKTVKEETAESEQAPAKEKQELAKVEEQTIKAVEEFVQDTLKAMNMEVEITSSVDEDGALCVDMKGDHMGILIGKRGQTLDALQYLANRVANKHQDGYVRVKLDTENYRARREETLKHLAKNIAHKVKRNRRPVALEPMNPYERRIIHSALQSDPYVTTHSEGEEPYRKVVVTLKK
ncbi:protein jag [Mediterraneibacter glycyrrhizinilyticus]|uniref:RNA-binding protein KhpB n=1 Tax=Candidatus Mediterraneibacter faecipullorum TaxID=2838670 RepID=A0A9D2STJ4_9FIRM|nr:RNA-binding cell elongation regulator Jag/EloR [Mediterraneibacter glycyrrhizinilyticus]MBM6803548.1 protein jag [Mediterraneibacter glycyrrhizinilyticus]MDM8126471.1 RNA-binding cell elongation regulator Jag/EloR [Mediterraneibacter glycyrrhizinilyticus]MDM8211728.1 RNA-binding cell elongation regulator Jag/EloR [Mediterraneibacter glycyrrhizinilyticus]HJC33360.1 Jag N-terminal domain-containing protein [Candidatus Mediterraneibacter faecipullorum]